MQKLRKRWRTVRWRQIGERK